jgi:hypothetical protein
MTSSHQELYTIARAASLPYEFSTNVAIAKASAKTISRNPVAEMENNILKICFIKEISHFLKIC